MKDVADYDSAYERCRLSWLQGVMPGGCGRAVEIGCASGVTTQLISSKGWDVVGLDIDEEAVRRARIRDPGGRYEAGTASDCGRYGPVDLVVALEVIEHVAGSEQLAFLQSLRAAMHPEGLLLLSTPGRYSSIACYERLRRATRGDFSYDWWDPTHIGVLSVRRLRRLIAAAGFTIARSSGFMLLPVRFAVPRGFELPLLRRLAFDQLFIATPSAG